MAEKINQISREDILKNIKDSLGQEGVASRTVLVGEAGIGKTWLAKEVSKRVTQGTSSSYKVLWLNLNKKIVNDQTLYENIAAQLSLFHEYEEGEEHSELDNSVKSLQDKIKAEIIKSGKKNLLLILDDEGSMTTENYVMKELKLQEFLEKQAIVRTLVTRRKKLEEEKSTIEVNPLCEDEALNLLKNSENVLESIINDPRNHDWKDLLQRLCDNKEIKENTLISCIASKSKGLPAAIVVLNKTLQSIKSWSENQLKIFKELILSPKSLEAAAASKNARDRSRYNPVLRLSYELLKPNERFIACFWHILDFYKYSGCAYYRDLIVHWMLEGYFDPVKSVEKAYQEGHAILMEFMNRGILKIQEDNMVVPEMSMSNLLDLQDCGFFGRSRLGFNRVYGGIKSQGLGRIIVIDDMIQTIQSKDKKIKTIVVSGNRLRREVSGKFFERTEMKDLEVVVLFEPTFENLVKSLSELKKLRVLVIRDCNLIQNIDTFKDFKDLQVLEVSGASSLAEIPDNFFDDMKELQSLNLSGLPIKSSPPNIENLSKLRCFILRDCPNLQDLPNFNVDTKYLEVIDIHGARKLESYFDRVKDWKDYKGKNKNFAHLRKLEHLDFSETQIIRLPIFHLKDSTNDFSTMPALTRLLVRNCTKLRRLPQLKPLTNLQIFDVSGSTMLVEMLEVCLEEKKELRILNISETGLPELADTIADVVNLNQLLIRNCLKMKELPKIENLTHLEVFDVSGCNILEKIDGTFGKMSYLHKVNLSGTNLSELPKDISELSNLKELIIQNCLKLKTLPNLDKLTHLEILDVSGCNNLEKMDGSFGKMSYLVEVNLLKTKLEPIPEFPEQSIIPSSKLFVHPDSRVLKGDTWSEIRKCLEMKTKGSSSDNVSDKAHQKLVQHVNRYKVLDPEAPNDIIDITMNLGTEVTSKAEFVSISENESKSLASIFEKFQMRSVKGCWVERCKNMGHLFESDENLPLETLWISNLPLLTKIVDSSDKGFVFQNLKKLSIDCCPKLKFIFPKALKLPEKLENLRVTFCDNLVRLFEEGGELPNLRKLFLLDLPVLLSDRVKFPKLETYTKDKCPNFEDMEDELRIGTQKIEEAPKEQPQKNVEPEIQNSTKPTKTTGSIQQ